MTWLIKTLLTSSVLVASGAATAAETVKYSYDAKGRLVKVTHTGSKNDGLTQEYTHDKVDNRTRMKVTGSPNSPP